MNTAKRRMFIGVAPWTPVYESGSLWLIVMFRRAKFEWILRRFPAHWGLVLAKFVGIYTLPHTAWCLPTRLVRRGSGGPVRHRPLRRNCQFCV